MWVRYEVNDEGYSSPIKAAFDLIKESKINTNRLKSIVQVKNDDGKRYSAVMIEFKEANTARQLTAFYLNVPIEDQSVNDYLQATM